LASLGWTPRVSAQGPSTDSVKVKEISQHFLDKVQRAVKSRNPRVKEAAANWIGDIATTPVVLEAPAGKARGKGQGTASGGAKAAGQSEGAGQVKAKGKGQPDAGSKIPEESKPDFDVGESKTRGWKNLTFVTYLGTLIRDKDARVRAAAIRALGKVHPSADVVDRVLRPLFQSGKSTQERQAAAAALVNLEREISRTMSLTAVGPRASPREVVALGQTVVSLAGMGLKDDDREVRRSCADAVQLAAYTLYKLFPIRSKAVSPRDEAATAVVGPLVKELAGKGKILADRLQNDPDGEVRLRVCRALENMALARGLMPPLETDTSATDVLWTSGLQPAVKVLERGITGTTDPQVPLRLAKLHVLEALEAKAAQAKRAVVRALADPNKFVRWEAARILLKMGQPVEDAVPALARMLDSTQDLDLRKQAAATLDSYGPKASQAAPALIAAAREAEDAEFRTAVFHTLQRVGKKALGKRLPQVIDALAGALASEDRRVRIAAAETLGSFGSKAQKAAKALRDVQEKAAKALRDVQENDEDAEVRRIAGEALINMEAETEEK
jgi:HEAT repeat protein